MVTKFLYKSPSVGSFYKTGSEILAGSRLFYIYTADIQVMRVTRWIVLPLLPKVLYKLGSFEGIVKSGKKIRQISWMIFKVTLKRFCMLKGIFYSIREWQQTVKWMKNLPKEMRNNVNFFMRPAWLATFIVNNPPTNKLKLPNVIGVKILFKTSW